MLVGLPPFYSTDRQILYRNILQSSPDLPQTLSTRASDLLMRLLEKDPNKRLGSQRGIEEIKEHPFFRTIDWGRVYKKQMKPPIQPNPRVSYFDEEVRNTRISNFSFVNDARQFRTYSEFIPTSSGSNLDKQSNDINYFTWAVQAEGSKTCKVDEVDENFAAALGRLSKNASEIRSKVVNEEIKKENGL